MTIFDPAPFPREIRLENTNACNAHCTICPRESMTRRIGFMERALLENIIAEAKGKPLSKFTLQGYGEPLLSDRFCDDMRLIKKELDCPTFTVTNAADIPPDRARDLVTCGLDKIKVSFYGIGKKDYEKVHTPLKYEKTLASIMNLIRAKRKTGSKIYIRLQYIGPFWKFIPFALRWITRAHIGYNTLHNYGAGRAYRKAGGEGKHCPILTRPILQVLWNGDVVPCCYDFDGRMVLGNLFNETIEAVWHGERYRKLRDAHRADDFTDWPICKVCDKRF